MDKLERNVVLGLVGLIALLVLGGVLWVAWDEYDYERKIEEARSTAREEAARVAAETAARSESDFRKAMDFLQQDRPRNALEILERIRPHFEGNEEFGEAYNEARETVSLAQVRSLERQLPSKSTEISDSTLVTLEKHYGILAEVRPESPKYKAGYAKYSRLAAEARSRQRERLRKQEEAAHRAQMRRSSKLELLSWRWYRHAGSFVYVKGQVQNITRERLENVEAVATFNDANGNFITSDSALIEYNPLLPGQKSPFTIIARWNPAMKTASLDFKMLFGGTIPWIKSDHEE